MDAVEAVSLVPPRWKMKDPGYFMILSGNSQDISVTESSTSDRNQTKLEKMCAMSAVFPTCDDTAEAALEPRDHDSPVVFQDCGANLQEKQAINEYKSPPLYDVRLLWDPGGKMSNKTIRRLEVIKDKGTPRQIVWSVNEVNPVISMTIDSDRLKNEQIKDKDLAILAEWLINGKQPSEGALFSLSAAGKFYWINKERFILKEEVIYKVCQDGKPVLIIPESLTIEILELNHNLPGAGRQGICRTEAAIREKYFWLV